MTWLRFGTLSVGSLTTSILLLVITIYLLSLPRKPREAWYLTGYFGFLCLLLISYTIRYSFFSSACLYTGHISNLIVFGVVCLLQFAYHYEGNRNPLESAILLGVSLAIALVVWGSLIFRQSLLPKVYDFRAQYFTYNFGPRVSYFVLAGYIWTFVVLIRKTILVSAGSNPQVKRGLLKNLFQPRGRGARSLGSFALLTLATMVLPVLYMLFQTGIISRALYALLFNSGSLLICLLIFIIYINNAPQSTSFRNKLVGIPLALIMVTFGITASAMTPLLNRTLANRYQIALDAVRAAIEHPYTFGISEDIVYILPKNPQIDSQYYASADLSAEQIIYAADVEGEKGILSGRSGLQPLFYYVHLEDTDSFFFFFELTQRGIHYRIGFRYLDYRLAIHRFMLILVLVAFAVAPLVVFGFPLVFKSGLLDPLRNLLVGVLQVETGNYAHTLPVPSGDEIGQLARGYNRMIEALQNAEGNFKALAENANDAILILSEEGTIVYANTRAAEISGYSAAELRQQHFSQFLPPHELRTVEKRLADRMQGLNVPPCYETSIRDKNNTVIPVEITGARTIWHHHNADVVIIRDISERKQTEELVHAQRRQLMQADKLASLGALVAGVAHEVNNPNQVVSMNTRFLVDSLPALFSLAESEEEPDGDMRIGGLAYDEFKSAAQSALEEINGSAFRIHHIVEELKNFVRGEQTVVESVDVNHVIRTVVDLSRHMIRKATHHLDLQLTENLPRVSIDRIQLEQVILNLVQNACQSLPDSNRRINIFTRMNEQHVVIDICDEGRGIPAADLLKITDPFFTTRKNKGGTGLGLSISARIVRGCGGSLNFSSRIGKGTTATVILPAEKGA